MGILERFGLQQAEATENGSTWRIPSYRADLQRDVDLIEEIVRAFGIENVPVRDRSRFAPESEADRTATRSALRRRTAARGLSEVRSEALPERESKS